MPTLPTQELERNGHNLNYGEHDGVIRNKRTGEETKFIQQAGVYFLQLMLPKDGAHKCGAGPSKDFARHGWST